jgi:heptosyltransferase-1
MRIVIVKLSALGDIVHAMAMLEFIKHEYPDAIIDWVIEERFKDILLDAPNINQVHCVNLKQAKQEKSFKLFLKEIKKLKNLKRYDIVIDAQGLIKSAILAKFIPSQQTWGFDKQSIREPLARFFYTHCVNIAYEENIIKRNATLFNSALKLNITKDKLLKKQAFLTHTPQVKNQSIILVLGASFAVKQYPIENFAKVIKLLNISPIVIWGNEAEYQLAKCLKQLAPAVHLNEKMNLTQLGVLIAKADLVIGGDTGPVHMAWASNVASIMLFGATPAYRNTFITPINQVLESDSVVNPLKINKKDNSIKYISPELVAQRIKALLEFV